MTGYGKASFFYQGVAYIVEVYSVNRKMLDIAVFLPKEYQVLEIDIRKWISLSITRGQITVKLLKATSSEHIENCLPDFKLFKSYKKAWEGLLEDLFMPREHLTLAFLMEQFSAIPKAYAMDLDPFKEVLEKACQEALGALVHMKLQEGAQLEKTLFSYLDNLQQQRQEIEKEAVDIAQECRKKLEMKLQEFDIGSVEIQEKIAREVVLYVDKLDISEELVRLKAHEKQFKDKMSLQKGSVGKELEFLLIEMQREINTIASKSSKLSILNRALSIKGEIEKIKEQVFNIE